MLADYQQIRWFDVFQVLGQEKLIALAQVSETNIHYYMTNDEIL